MKRFYGNQHSQKDVVEQQQPDDGDHQESQEKGFENGYQGESFTDTPTVSNSKVKDIPTDTPKQSDANITE